MENITNTLYEVQDQSRKGVWRTYATFSTRSQADDCLHRTGTYEGLSPLATSSEPRWRIVQIDTIERSTVVANISAVWDSEGLALS